MALLGCGVFQDLKTNRHRVVLRHLGGDIDVRCYTGKLQEGEEKKRQDRLRAFAAAESSLVLSLQRSLSSSAWESTLASSVWAAQSSWSLRPRRTSPSAS